MLYWVISNTMAIGQQYYKTTQAVTALFKLMVMFDGLWLYALQEEDLFCFAIPSRMVGFWSWIVIYLFPIDVYNFKLFAEQITDKAPSSFFFSLLWCSVHLMLHKYKLIVCPKGCFGVPGELHFWDQSVCQATICCKIINIIRYIDLVGCQSQNRSARFKNLESDQTRPWKSWDLRIWFPNLILFH